MPAIKAEKRNGTIELLRIVFCVIILIHHVTLDVYGRVILDPEYQRGVLRYGALGVEFFFMTSGFFMARSAARLNGKHTDGIDGSLRFVLNKIKPILFYHVLFNVMMLTYAAIVDRILLQDILDQLQSFLFLPAVGFANGSWILGAEWYIGAMLFAMAVIHPFLTRWFDLVSKYVSSLLCLTLYVYLMKQYHSVMGTDRMIRAFAGLLMGIAVYQGAQIVAEKLSSPDRRSVSAPGIAALFVIAGYMAYMASSLKRDLQPMLVVLLGMALTVVFAERGPISSTGLSTSWAGSACRFTWRRTTFVRSWRACTQVLKRLL